MELLSIKCPNCTGITEVDSSKVQSFCQYCGTLLETAKSISERPIEEKIEVNFADIKQMETQYFNDEQQFNDVLIAYNRAALAEANNADFWLARARFYAKGNLKEFEAGSVSAVQRKMIVDQYVLWMETAIEHYIQQVGNATRLKMEKEKTIGDINNTFEGKRKRVMPEARAKEGLESQRQEEEVDEAEVATEEVEKVAAKKKKRNIIIAVSAVVLLLLVLLLRSCGSHEEEDVTSYEEFLTLSHVLELLNDEATRSEVLDLNVDFGDQNDAVETLSVTAPAKAELDTVSFHFDEADILTRITIVNANYFNGFPASEGLVEDIPEALEVEAFEIDGNVLSFIIDEFAVMLTLRSDQFNIDVSRLTDELTAEQREIWDLIEERIEAGYNSWSELTAWAMENEIRFTIREDGERPVEAMRSLIDQYGFLGDYIKATPGLGSMDDPDEIMLFLHFENLTYNDTIAELSGLNRNSGRELTSWLENGGLGRLEMHFEAVELLVYDDNGEQLTAMPEVVEFVHWDIDFFDRLMPEGEGIIRIISVYRVLEVEIPEEADEDEEEDETPELGPTTLSSGTWIVGEDIPQGRYVITGDHSGNFVVRRGTALLVNEILGGSGDLGVSSITTYLLTGDEIEISGINNTNFNPITNRTLSNTLGTGNWVVGVDIPAGQFDATAPSGSGNLVIWRGDNLRTNEILGDGNFGEERVSVSLANGDVITISGLEQVVFE